ncbi:MAG TPA: hypothetical protein VEP90_18060 [Methylomirabilota bacterium]|nr:hypothetical protein [Methylomirabilota bacterium]
MRNNTLPYPLTEPPAILKKARLDNIALVPASLLKNKAIYQPIANTLPTGSVLVVPGTLSQQKIMAKVTSFFRDHGRSVITMPIEKITSSMKKAPRPAAENLPLAF